MGVTDIDWLPRAACRTTDVEMIPDNREKAGPAVAVCHHCPVRRQCAQRFVKLHAARLGPTMQGVWAGVWVPPNRGDLGPEVRVCIVKLEIIARHGYLIESLVHDPGPTNHFGSTDTHCKHGHPWTEESLGTTRSGSRYCRLCQRKAKQKSADRVARHTYVRRTPAKGTA